MANTVKSYAITVDRGSRGFGLSLIYRGMDKYTKEETGIFIAKVIAEGQAERSGVLEGDKIITINAKTPKNVDDAVDIIKAARNEIKLIIRRQEREKDCIKKGDEGQEILRESQKLSPSLGLLLEREDANAENQPIYANVVKSTDSIDGTAKDKVKEKLRLLRKEQSDVKLQPISQKSATTKDTDHGILDSVRPLNVFKFEKSEYPDTPLNEDTENVSTNVKRTILRGGAARASTRSLHDVRPGRNTNSQFRQRSNSSSRMTRKEEKSALQGLNDRLAGYIDQVRAQQNRNSTLYHQIRTFEEYKQLEINDVKNLYEKQVEELKNALENTRKNYNQLQAGAEGLLNENNALKGTVQDMDISLSNSIDKENTLKEELWNLGNKVSRTEYEHRTNQNKLTELLPELHDLRSRLNDTKEALDREYAKGVDLDKKCQQLEEELKLKMALLERELVDVKYQKETEINTIDGALHDEYEDRLQKELQELRDRYTDKMQENRDYFEERYQNRFRELQSELTRKHGSTAGSTQELKESRARIDALHRKISELERENLVLNQKIADMTQELNDQPSNHRAQLSSKDEETTRLINELSDQMSEYQHLHEIKIALDMEIAVFRQLIESEEDRFEELNGMTHDGDREPFTIERRTTVRNSERRLVHRGNDLNSIKHQ